MTLPLRRVLALAASSVLTLTALGAAAPTPASAAGYGHARPVTGGDFADPGFAKFGSFYYIYKTGPTFGVRTSVQPESSYGPAAASMPARPAWVAKTALLWAPDVFASSSGGKPLYVMYFTAVKAGWGTHCVGVATSRTPDRGFKAKSKPLLCAKTKGWETIDPSAYRAADGKRYLLYKLNKGNTTGFDIRVAQMDSATGTKRTAAKTRSKIKPGSRMEAPSVISHGGRVWLFTSRRNWADCSYATDVWSAPTLWNGSFTRVRTIMTRKSTGLCGPGGATVLQDGSTTRIAFHAWVDKNKDGVKDTSAAHPKGVRRAWVGVLGWNSAGQPYLY